MVGYPQRFVRPRRAPPSCAESAAAFAVTELRGAVRRALHVHAGAMTLTLALTATSSAFAHPLSAEFELASLLADAGGDGSAGFVLNGIDPGDSSGRPVGAAGDLNGDGIDDLFIGAYGADPSGRADAGETYVLFGRDTARSGNFPPERELSTLLPSVGGNGSTGFVLTGIDANDRSGRTVSAAGDVNGDGIDDLIIGAGSADPGGRTDAGETYVVFGRNTARAGSFPAIFPLSSLLAAGGGDGSAGFMLAGIDPLDRSGVFVNTAGDLNADGIDDLFISAVYGDPGGRSNAGESYVVFGRDTTLVGNFPPVVQLGSLLPAGGGNGGAGFVLTGIDAEDRSGVAASSAGDVNGDGIDDLIIGATYADPAGQSNAGETYLVFGRDTAVVGNFPALFPLASLRPAAGGDGSAGFVLSGIVAEDLSGRLVSAAGDINDDGIGDLIIGAYGANPNGFENAGESFVVFGRDTGNAGNFPAIFPLADLLPANGGDGSAGFVLHGIDAYDMSGRSVSAAGDVNADGIDDVVIGAHAASPGGIVKAGESYVVFGRDTAIEGNFPAVFLLGSLLSDGGGDGTRGCVFNGIDAGDYSGRSASAAGDIDGDGIDDLIVGARGADPGGRDRAGESYVVFGRGALSP
jgi:hypothetical protein